MLKTVDPRMNAEVLYALALMGHGDVIVLADANFPAASTATQTSFGRLLRLDNLSLSEAVECVLTQIPLDDLRAGACRMRVDDAPEVLPPVQAEAIEVIRRFEGGAFEFQAMERNEFYDNANKAYAVILTGERRFYGTVLLRKGVFLPPNPGN